MKLTSLGAATVSLLVAGSAQAQSFRAGDAVYASPTYSAAGWLAGCKILDGPGQNDDYGVMCRSSAYPSGFRTQGKWIRAASAGPPAPVADPMRPGQMVAMPGLAPEKEVTSGVGHYAEEMQRQIDKDAASAKPASLKTGAYPCYSGPPLRYTFTDLLIRSSTSYSDSRGHAGSYSYSAATGVLTFRSGPYAGAYSRMLNATTVGLSAPGSTTLGTQCNLKR